LTFALPTAVLPAAAFARRDGELHCENVPLSLIAERFGTPTYVYSKASILAAYAGYAEALAGQPALVCYAMKANPNLAIVNLLARQGSGFDIVSGGELQRVLAAGGDPAKVVFSGVGKTEAEIEAALAAGILSFNLESIAELEVVERVAARMGRRAPVSVRTNPDVDPKTHPYITTGLKSNKFGVAYADTLALYRRAAASAQLGDRVSRRSAAGAGRSDPRTARPHAGARPRRQDPDGGARPLDRRTGWRAADPGHPAQAGRDQELRHRRCGHERPAAAGALPGVDAGAAGAGGHRGGGALRRRRPGVRVGRLAGARARPGD